MPLDVLFSSTFSSPSNTANIQLWQSSTTISNLQYHYVFASKLPSPFTLHVSDLPNTPSTSNYVAFDYYAIYNNATNQGAQAASFTSSNPLVIPVSGGPGLKNATVEFKYYVVAPVTQGCTVLGEFSKFITVSKQRVQCILSFFLSSHFTITRFSFPFCYLINSF